jgi:hypothetical protein
VRTLTPADIGRAAASRCQGNRKNEEGREFHRVPPSITHRGRFVVDTSSIGRASS